MPKRVAVAPAKHIPADKAAGIVTSGMWLDYGTGLCQPDVFDRALAARITGLSNVKVRHCLTMRPRAVHECDPEGRHIHSFSLHFAPPTGGCTTRDAAATSRSISARSPITTGASWIRWMSSCSRPVRWTSRGTSI